MGKLRRVRIEPLCGLEIVTPHLFLIKMKKAIISIILEHFLNVAALLNGLTFRYILNLIAAKLQLK